MRGAGGTGGKAIVNPIDELREVRQMYAHQDECLVAIENYKPVPTEHLRALPPWRAVLIANVAAKAATGTMHKVLEDGTPEQVGERARAVTSSLHTEGTLGQWWPKAAR